MQVLCSKRIFVFLAYCQSSSLLAFLLFSHWKPNICLSVFNVKEMMVEELQCLLVKWTAHIFLLGIQNMRVLKRKKISFAELLIRRNTMTCHL